MTGYTKHVFEQGPVIRTVAGVAVSGLRQHEMARPGTYPRPAVSARVPARSPGLVKDYIRYCGGDPEAYGKALPAHLFPQWGMPLMSRTLQELPYNLTKVMNAGYRFELRQKLPSAKPLLLQASLENVDDNGSRALITQKLVTGTADAPAALVAFVTAFVPLGGGGKEAKPKVRKERPIVPHRAREIAQWQLSERAGLDFALLTGDFNPIHWIRPYARMAGFEGKILHGFALGAKSAEAIIKKILAGDPSRLKQFEARFLKPVVLPGTMRLYVDDQGAFFVGAAPGGHANLTGSYNQ